MPLNLTDLQGRGSVATLNKWAAWVETQLRGGNTGQNTALTSSRFALTRAGAASTLATSANLAATSAVSYRPATNPLSATDAGSNATITIANFNMNIAGKTSPLAITGNTLTGRSYGTVYFIYYTDPNLTGGSVTFTSSTSKSPSPFYVGSITTPLAGAPDTIGNNDGGTGAQIGFAANLWAGNATATLGGSYITNLSNANDGNLTNFATVAPTGNSQQADLVTSLYSGISPFYGAITLNIRTEVTNLHAASGDTGFTSAFLDYSLDGGVTFTNIYTVQTASGGGNASRALKTDSVSLSVAQNIAAVQVKLTVSTGNNAGDNASVKFYEAWLSVSG